MRRILHIIDSLGNDGTSKQLLLQAFGLARSGFDVHIAELDAPPGIRQSGWDAQARSSTPTDSAIPVTNLGRRFPIDPLANLRLLRYVNRLQPDVVHTWNTVSGMLGAVGSQNNLRLILGCHRIERWQSAWEGWNKRRFARHAERCVTNSPTVRDWCTKRGVPVDTISVVLPGVPQAPKSDVSREELLRELQLPGDARLIGVVGRLVPEKRVQDLIWAADLLRVLHDNLRMLIIGDGPLRTQLEQYARMASDLDHIRFLGERKDTWRIMPHLDVIWNGSDNRNVSMAILEGMAAGVPVIASDVPVNRELVVHGETGYLIPIGRRSGRADRARHTDRIFSDAELTGRLAVAARRRATSCFNADQMNRRYVDIYTELIS